MLGANAESLSQLLCSVHSITDTRLRDIIDFAIKCSRDPQSLSSLDYAILHAHGLRDSMIVEIIGMSALAVYANIIADATNMEPDEMFSN